MFGLIKQATKSKTNFPTALIALLVPFCVFLGNFADVLHITFRRQAVPIFLDIVFKLAGIILGAVFYHFMLGKLASRNNKESSEPPAANKSGSSLPVSVLNFFFGSALILSLKHLLPVLYRPEPAKGFFIAAALSILLVFLLVIFFIASWRIIDGIAGVKDYFSALSDTVKLCFGRFPFFISMFLITLLSLAAGVILFELSWSFLKSTSLTPLLSYFYHGCLVSCYAAFILVLLFKAIISVLTGNAPWSASRNPLPGYILLLVFFLGALFNIVPAAGSAVNIIDDQYKSMIAAAEKNRNDDKLYLCGSRYKAAYALTQAYLGYLASEQASKDKALSEAAKNELLAKADQSFKTAYEFWPGGGLVYYLDAMRQTGTNSSSSISLLEKARVLDPALKDADFILLELYKQNNIKDKVDGIVASLIKDGAFVKPPSISSLGSGAIKKYIEEYGRNEKLCLENITTAAVFYYENQLYKEAMDELTRLAQVIPDDLAVNYMIAVTDLEIKADNKPYTAAIEASQKILRLYPGEEWAEDFATGIAMRAGNQEIMESSLKESYAKNPGNLDVAEQYAYSILKKNYDFNYTEAAKQAEEIVDGILSKDPNRWFALYCKAVIELFKKEYENSLQTFEKFTAIITDNDELHSIYDDFYNLYVLKFKELMLGDPKAKEAIAPKEASNPFLYNYIQGAFLWRNTDYDNSEKFLKIAINYMPDFSKPYFLLGNVYFEKAGVNNLPDYYIKAEEQYRKALAIFPEDPYAWFSLAHVLKKTGRLEEALGAFQKTLSYMPAEDHKTDHFGISIHSTYQIQEIKELLKKKGAE